MTKRRPARHREARRILLEPGLEFLAVGFTQGGKILGKKLHLLRHAALDNGVVLVQAERQRLAVEDLLAYLAVHQPAHLLGRGRAPPLRHPPDFQLAEVIVGQLDPTAIPLLNRCGVQRLIHGKQRQSGQQKVQQRLAQPALEQRWPWGTGHTLPYIGIGTSHSRHTS